MNGTDNLSYLDISSSLVVPFTELSNPSAPTLGTNGVGGTGFNVYYRVTANSTVGETAASNALTVAVDTERDLWNPPSAGGTDFVTINWSAVSSAQSYNVYLGTVSGFEYLIASGVNGTTFTDDGTFAQDTTRLFPSTNSTAGPKVAGGTVINGRAFLVLDKDHPYYVRWGGDPGFELDFSPANGGGFVPVGEGTKDLPIVIKSFRDGQGNPQITVLCQGTNGLGKRYIMSPDQITVGETILTFYSVTEDNGKDGTDSRDGVIFYGDSLYYPSRDGFKTTGTKPQLQNVLSTDRISNTIQTDLDSLNNEAMSKAVGLGYEGRLYWALPVNSSMNNEIWVFDLDRKGAWMKPWSIAANWMTLYNDNSGNTHHLVLSGNKIYALSRSALTNDNGTPFITNGQSGEIYFSKDKRMWVQLLQVVMVISAPRGNINFQVTGKTEDNPLQALGDPMTFTPTRNQNVIGWGEINTYIKGWGRNAWSKVNGTPESSSSATQECLIEIDEEVQWATYSWNTTDSGVDYSLLDVVFEYIEVGLRDLQ